MTPAVPGADEHHDDRDRASEGGPIPKAATGIPGVDEITGGGIPAGRTTLVLGGPGAGKTVFALETLVNAARREGEPGIFVALEESSRQIIANAATFGWDLPQLERDQLFFLDAQLSPAVVQVGDFDISAMLAALEAKAREMGARRIVFDGIDVLLMLLDDPAKERREIYRLQEWLQSAGLTAIITGKVADGDRLSSERYAFMQFMVDAVVALHHRMVDRVSLRGLRVTKYRGSGFAEGEFPLVISPTGIRVATFGSASLEHPVFTERVSTGVSRLDNMLDGGYFRGSSILVSGSPGVAKTTLAAAFSRSACERGERTLYVSFDESGDQIVRNLRSVGMALGGYADAGLLAFHSIRTESRSAEEHLIDLQELIRRFDPTSLVIDPVSALMKTGGHVAAVHASLRLLDFARARGITTVCTTLLDDAGDAGDESTLVQVSTIADTWIHLAYMVRGGERNRTLTVVKSRGMKHSNQVRELVLSDDGVTLADVFTAGGEVLLGTARWEHEARLREQDERERLERARIQRAAEQSVARIRAQIAALEAEQAAHLAEIDAAAVREQAHDSRRDADHETLLRLRHADADLGGRRPLGAR